jgi:hypothetical protein
MDYSSKRGSECPLRGNLLGANLAGCGATMSESPTTAALGAVQLGMKNILLRDELLEMQRADLELRGQLAAEGTLSGGYNELMAALHRQHNARLREILSEHGWPGHTLVGEDGAEAAWLLLQHAILDPELMRGAVQLVELAVQTGDTEPKYFALLVDRIRTLEGQTQVYGSQHDWDDSGNLSPLPIEDVERVDARRRSVGLDPLAQTTQRLRAQAAAEGQRPPADYGQYRRAAQDWARSLGWNTLRQE